MFNYMFMIQMSSYTLLTAVSAGVFFINILVLHRVRITTRSRASATLEGVISLFRDFST